MTRLGEFLLIGLLLEARCSLFYKDEVAQRKGDILGFLVLKHFFLHFHPNMQFRTWVVEGIVRFQMCSGLSNCASV